MIIAAASTSVWLSWVVNLLALSGGYSAGGRPVIAYGA
jgi:hypothetical protein